MIVTKFGKPLPVCFKHDPPSFDLGDFMQIPPNEVFGIYPSDALIARGWRYVGITDSRFMCLSQMRGDDSCNIVHSVIVRDSLRYKEARVLKHLGPHVGIMGLEDELQYGYLMEYIPGESLSYILATLRKKDNLLKYSLLIPIFSQVAKTLDFIHSKGVTHGDLKTTNIMVLPFEDGSFITKIIDFQEAKLPNDKSERDDVEWTINPPEGNTVTKETDIWYLGLALRDAFVDSNEQKPVFDSFKPHPKLKQLIESCMSDNPQARPTARQVAEKLGEVEVMFCDADFRREFPNTEWGK